MVDGLRAPALRPQPNRVRVGGGFRTRWERVERDSLPCPIVHRGNRERALGAVFLGNGEPSQRSRVRGTPLPETDHRCGFFLWGVPEVVLYPGRLCASLLRDSLDGEGARGKRVPQQRAQALDCAPSPCLHCLDDPPLQGPSLTMARCPVDHGPGLCRYPARGRLEFHDYPGETEPRFAVCLVCFVRSHPQEVSRLAAQGHAGPLSTP